MTDYLKVTDFATKDGLSTGNPLKIISGTEIDAEFESIETSIGTKADLISPTFSGVPIAPQAASGTVTNQIATCSFVTNSVQLAGTPTAPTATAGTNTTQIATTAFVTTAVQNGITGGTADIAIDEINANIVYFGQTTTGFRMYESGGYLYFMYNGNNIARLSSAGQWACEGDVGAFVTV